MSDHCGHSVTDSEGEAEPCGRPVTGWRWYQDVGEHEDMLDTACSWHENEGGNLIASQKARLAAVEALADEWEDTVKTQRTIMTTPQANAYRSCIAHLRAAVGAEPSEEIPA